MIGPNSGTPNGAPVASESWTAIAPTGPLAPAVADELLALGDDELIIGHRHSEWLGLSPFLEEDLTMSSIAQDEFGHARALYALIWPAWTDRESGVTRRPASQWRSCSLVEAHGTPWEASLIRHFLYDLAEPLRWTAALRFEHLVPGLADLVPTVLSEERFHQRHATDLVFRLGSEAVGAAHLQPHLDALAPHALAMLDGLPDAVTEQFIAAVAGSLPSGLRSPFQGGGPGAAHADRTLRSAAFADVHASLLAVVAFDPTARW